MRVEDVYLYVNSGSCSTRLKSAVWSKTIEQYPEACTCSTWVFDIASHVGVDASKMALALQRIIDSLAVINTVENVHEEFARVFFTNKAKKAFQEQDLLNSCEYAFMAARAARSAESKRMQLEAAKKLWPEIFKKLNYKTS